MKILILKPSSLGDVVQALPVLRVIKRHLPHVQAWWWIDLALGPLLEYDPDLAGIHPFPRRRWSSPRHWPEIWTFLRRLRRERFDWVIDLQSLARSGVFAWLANGRCTIGLDDAREGARGFYDLVVRRPTPLTHAVDWYLEVPRALAIPIHAKFDWLPQRPDVARAVETRWQTSRHAWIALQPGARWENKRWPLDHFAALVRLVANAQPSVRFVILGSQSDRSLAAPLADAAPGRCLDLTGQTTLPEMVEWLRQCRVLVTNDTGPMHVAAALNRPVVALFGPTEPRRTGPYGQPDAVLQNSALPCVPCMADRCTYAQPLECLRSIPPAHAAAAVLQHLPCPA